MIQSRHLHTEERRNTCAFDVFVSSRRLRPRRGPWRAKSLQRLQYGHQTWVRNGVVGLLEAKRWPIKQGLESVVHAWVCTDDLILGVLLTTSSWRGVYRPAVIRCLIHRTLLSYTASQVA